jgi:hypothetical protein
MESVRPEAQSSPWSPRRAGARPDRPREEQFPAIRRALWPSYLGRGGQSPNVYSARSPCRSFGRELDPLTGAQSALASAE